MNEILLRIYRMQRANGARALDAMRTARYETKAPAYPWLEAFDQYTHAYGIVGPFEVKVWCTNDPDGRLGDDDVTGEFTDTWSEGCVSTRCSGREYKWYRPSTYTLKYAMAEYRQAGMSRQDAQRAYDKRVQDEMAEDRERSWWGVIATAYIDGTDVGEASLWGIDETPNYDPARYLRDVAEDLISEAIDYARKDMLTTIADTEARVSLVKLVSLVKRTKQR